MCAPPWFWTYEWPREMKKSPLRFLQKKMEKMSDPVTFRKMNIFFRDFFKTISTRSENSISGVFQACSAAKKRLWTIKMVYVKMKISDFDQNLKIKNQNFYFWVEMLFFRSEIDYKYCPLSENSISEVFQRFKSEIEDFVFLFHEKSDISPFCLTTLMAHSFFLVTGLRNCAAENGSGNFWPDPGI